MCGIFGSVNIKKVNKNLCEVLSRRGPDGSGFFEDSEHSIFLGHNRLSIIDLSEAGRQPMCNEDESIWITFNGEIYNFKELRSVLEKNGHVFKSRTDTEVIIHAYEEWGGKCLKEFNGMFAFCIWDRKAKKVFLARDRLGIKPIYYMENKDGFIFGSEPKVILAHPGVRREISGSALTSYLIYRYIAGEKSIWQGINRLEPGHYLIYDLDRKQKEVRQYWSIPLEQKVWKEEDALDRFEQLFSSAVKYRLISDVPLGVFLSGGIDSSAITSTASQFVPDINTFSIGFAGSARSELSDARTVATHLGTNHHEKDISASNIDRSKSIFSYMDEPLGDSSIIPTNLVCMEGKKHATVILAGDGGDELFGGYNWYTWHRKAMRLRPLGLLFGSVFKLLGTNGRLVTASRDPFELYRQMTSPRFIIKEIMGLFPWIDTNDLPTSENYLLAGAYRENLPHFKRWQYIDALTFMTDDILTKVDRASMANSLEVRVPFLDHRLVEFAFSLPDNLCIRENQKKYLLKKFLKKYLPDPIIQKPKQGFSCPVTSYWPVREMIRDVDTGELIRQGVICKKAWAQLRDQSRVPYRDAKIWLLAVLEKWGENWLFQREGFV